MISNAYLCGWYGTECPESARSMMQACFSAEKVEWFSNERLNIALTADVANLPGKVDVAIVGEPYWKNADLEKQASEHGHAQVIARIYLEKDMHFLDILAGRFSIVLFDHHSEQVVLCLDKMGQQHLYYAQSGNNLVFASRADAVVSHPIIDRKISNQGIYNYFYFHSMASPGSIYESVSKLENAQYLVFRNGRVNTVRYWSPEYIEENSESIESLSEEMLSIIERSVARSTKDRITGAFLSGGLDSSTVSGMLSKVSKGRARTFSIGFDAKGYDEMEYARLASKHFDTKQNEFYVTPENVIAEVPAIATYFDEPFGNSSALPAYFCAKMAKESGIERLLAGDGGDELFAGNERYAKQGVFESYYRIPAIFRGLFLEPLFLANPVTKHLPLLKKVYSYISQAKIPLPDRLESYNYLNRHAAIEIFTQEFLKNIDEKEPISILRDSYQQPKDTTPLNRMMWLDWKRTLHDNDLVKVNRMCEMAGVEVVYPLLDDELVCFSQKIPSHIKINNGRLRWFFKESVKGMLPPEIINKTKQGFGLPFGIWTSENKDLQILAYECLNRLKQYGIFNSEFIDQTIKMHQTIHAKFYGELVWLLMMLELWLSARNVPPDLARS